MHNQSTTPTISVIVPVYNTEKYLRRCIDSVLAQTYADFELLLIDDGSKDKSGEICDEYAQKDARVRVFHKENGGVVQARRIGVEQSHGEYIYFLDSDDTILPDALELMCNYMTNGVDVVVFDSKHNGDCSSVEYAKLLLNYKDWAVWGKLYKRIHFDEGVFEIPDFIRVGEDFLINLNLLKNVKGRIVCKTIHRYLYNQNNPNSVQVSHKRDYQYEKSMVECVDVALSRLPFDTSLKEKFFHWKLDYLGGVIGYRYQVIYTDMWIQSLIVESNYRTLSLRETIIIRAAKGNLIARGFLVIYRSFKNMAGRIKKLLALLIR